MGDAVWDERAPNRSNPPTPTPVPESTRQRVNPLKVTDERDGELLNRAYSYWAQSWVGHDGAVYCFVGSAAGRPLFFSVKDGDVARLGPLVPYQGTGEGMYWDREGWVYLCDGPRLRRVNPFTGEDTVLFSIEQTHPGCRLWQAHSSDDGQAHSATVQQIVETGTYPSIGTVVFRNGAEQFFKADTYALDESQIDASGRYLLIKSSPDDDNLFIDLETGQPWPWLTKSQGALGHSDCGDGFVIGADRANGVCGRIELPSMERTGLFSTWTLGHVAVRGTRILISDAVNLSLFEDRLLHPIAAHGMVNPYPPDDPRSYDYQVFGNLSPDGSVAAFVSNKEGRMDLYLLFLEA